MDSPTAREASVELDGELVRQAEASGIDVRAAAEEAVRGLLSERSRREKELDDVKQAIRHVDRYVEEHGSFADAWRRF